MTYDYKMAKAALAWLREHKNGLYYADGEWIDAEMISTMRDALRIANRVMSKPSFEMVNAGNDMLAINSSNAEHANVEHIWRTMRDQMLKEIGLTAESLNKGESNE